MSEKYITPVCPLFYPWIFEPNKKFNPEGTYSVQCPFDDDDPKWKGLINVLTKGLEEFHNAQNVIAKKKLKRCEHLPWKNKDGQSFFVAKQNAFGTKADGTRFPCRVTVLGPDGKKITKEELDGTLGNGTLAVVGFTPNYWQNSAQGVGLTARLNFVQIIDPIWYSPLDGYTDVDGNGLVLYPVPERMLKKVQDLSDKMDGLVQAFENSDGGM